MTTTSADPEADNTFECVEIYVPKKLEHLSELYNYLRRKLTARGPESAQQVSIDGYSLYEVDGAFHGERVHEERTMVIRILLKRTPDDDAASIRHKINALGSEVAATVAIAEEELWICHYPQGVVIFRPDKTTPS